MRECSVSGTEQGGDGGPARRRKTFDTFFGEKNIIESGETKILTLTIVCMISRLPLGRCFGGGKNNERVEACAHRRGTHRPGGRRPRTPIPAAGPVWWGGAPMASRGEGTRADAAARAMPSSRSSWVSPHPSQPPHDQTIPAPGIPTSSLSPLGPCEGGDRPVPCRRTRKCSVHGAPGPEGEGPGDRTGITTISEHIPAPESQL